MENITYEEFINRILETRGRHGCGDEYFETHHIIPKCLDGTNDEENLIDLFAREHFVAHKLLALENPENDKLIYTWHMMAHMKRDGRDYELTEEEYEEVKVAFSQALSGARMGENNPNWGRHPSEETRKKLSLIRSGKNSPMYGKHKSEETRKKISESRKGKPAWNKGIPRTEEEKQRHSEKLKGRFAGEKSPNSKPIMCIETGEILWGAKAFEDKYGISARNIGSCCRGERYTAGGYHWEFANEEAE